MRDYYQILGISRTASEADVKKAFRAAASKTHPDKEGGTEAAFKEVYEAYDTLKDKERRRRYDEYLNSRSHQHDSRSSTHHDSKNESTSAKSATTRDTYKKEEYRRQQSFVYRARYATAFTFYIIERIFQAIGKTIRFIFTCIFQIIAHVLALGAFLLVTAIASLIVALIISLLSLFGLIPDPDSNILRAVTFCISIGGSVGVLYALAVWMDETPNPYLFLLRKKPPARVVDIIYRGLLGGALATTASYIFDWHILGMDMLTTYIAGFIIGGILRLLYEWSRGVDTRFDKH